jgi:hypothetical protein
MAARRHRERAPDALAVEYVRNAEASGGAALNEAGAVVARPDNARGFLIV